LISEPLQTIERPGTVPIFSRSYFYPVATVKKLVGAAALYGLSSIVARLLNFLLTPLHTAVLPKSEYGAYSDLYVFIAFLMVVLTYGMETAYFRFSQKKDAQPEAVYSTAQLSIGATTVFFLLILSLFYKPIAEVLRYGDRPELVWGMGAIVAMEALAAVPFARLRAQGKALRFVAIKTGLILVNIALNLVFYQYLPAHNPAFRADTVQWVLVANLGASVFMLLCLWPEFRAIRWSHWDKQLWKALLWFGFPLLLAGLPGVANEMADRFFIKYLLPADTSLAEVGTYSAVYKLSIFLVMFNQAFRYAAEPFFFKAGGEGDAGPMLARTTRAFLAVVGLGMVAVLAGLDYIKYFIAEKYWDHLHLLPILLLANLFLALNTQLSMGYKLQDKTALALRVTLVGFALTVGLNLWWIPIWGIEGAAWATLASYAGMTVVSYALGRTHFPVPYEVGKLGLYLLAAAATGYAAYWASGQLLLQLLALLVYVLVVFGVERPDRWRRSAR
jgi:O-antigen/teichoic acid export membrane protein